ncbi:LysR substrate-binding domain-containing protein [Pseudomonas sp. ABY48]|uniref:LysR substrate-binding domain-containing protein n=1 Tax=Pseudomonas sp. ABY48 TaxID=3402865 RepID=UPI003B429043
MNGSFTLDEPGLAKAVVGAAVALGFFMEQDVQAEIDNGEFERMLEDWTPARDNLCLYYPNRRNPSAALKAFTDLARANLVGNERLALRS